jgi:murein DD-endopeptidase MepM/ murein hydrolase activator NlpD
MTAGWRRILQVHASGHTHDGAKTWHPIEWLMGDGVRVRARRLLLAVLPAALPALASGCEGDIFPAEGILRAGRAFGPASAEEIERCSAGPLPGNPSVPLFDRVFEGRYPVINHFDHDEPHAFVDRNGRQIDWCGRTRTGEIDGHSGYDFLMPEGIAIRAAADGEVVWAGTAGPFHCPLEDGEVRDQLTVDIVHTLPDGRRVSSVYKHLSKMAVATGQRISRGQIIALSGNTGCSTVPHLHFETYLLAGPAGAPVLIDPFGWQGVGSDPWAARQPGSPSLWLWRPDQAPDIFSPPARR